MKRYKDAFTPVPEETINRVEDTLRRLPSRNDQPYVVRHPRWTVVLIAALVLTLCGGAVAAERLGVLNFLFGMSGTTEEQQLLVQNVNLTQTADMAAITVTDAVFDGRQLSMGLIFDTDQPTYAMAEGLWLNGTLVRDNDLSVRFSWINQTEGQKQTASGLTAIAGEALTGQIEVRLRVMLLQPRKAVKTFAEGDYASMEALRAAALQAAAEGYTPVDAENWSPVSIDPPRTSHFDTKTDYPNNRQSLALAETHSMDIEEVWLTFSIEASDNYTGETVYLDIANNDDLPFTVIVRRAELTLVGSHFVLDVYPMEGGLEKPADLDRFITNPFSFWGDRAKMLELQSTSTNHEQGGWMIDEQGQTFYRLVDETGPFQELPEDVWLVFESMPSFRSLWQWAIKLSPTDKAAAQEIPAAEAAGIIDGTEWPFCFIHGDAVVENGTLQCTAALSAYEGQEEAFERLWHVWAICDPEGNKLLSGTGAAYGSSDAEPDVCVIAQQVTLPDRLPDAVYLVPVDEHTNDVNWDYAILLPVGQD